MLKHIVSNRTLAEFITQVQSATWSLTHHTSITQIRHFIAANDIVLYIDGEGHTKACREQVCQDFGCTHIPNSEVTDLIDDAIDCAIEADVPIHTTDDLTNYLLKEQEI